MVHRKLLFGGLALGVALAVSAMVPDLFRADSARAVFTPPADRNWVAIDCDVVIVGVQDTCNAAAGTQRDVGIVVGNVIGLGSAIPQELAAFNFDLVSSDKAKLNPRAGVDSGLNGNPDFNEAAVTGNGWACSPPAPNPDVNSDGMASTSQSRLSCFNASLNGNSIPIGGSATIGIVHFDALVVGAAALTLANVSVGNDTQSAFASCNPDFDGTNALCGTATMNVVPNTNNFAGDVEMVVDCDASTGAIDSACTIPGGATTQVVQVYARNTTGAAFTMGTFNFNLISDNVTFATPPVIGSGLDANPDFNAGGTLGDWACGPPNPSPDTDASATTATSFISCFNGVASGPTIPDGGITPLARVTYNITGNGTVNFTLDTTAIFDDGFGSVHNGCDPVNGPSDCVNASASRGAVSTATNTPVAPTATNTPIPATSTPTRTNTPVPSTATNTPIPATSTPTRTNTPIPSTATNTPVPSTATNTSVPATSTNTPVGPTSTNTPIPPTSTATNTSVPATATNTSVPATATNTPIPPTATNTPAGVPTSTSTPVPATPTNTSVPATATNTSVPATATNTSVLATATNTSVPATATNTSVPATATNTSVPATATNTPVSTSTNTPVTSGTKTPAATKTAAVTKTAAATSTSTPPSSCLPFGQKLALFFGIIRRFGAVEGERRYRSHLDVNDDGVIDFADLRIVFETPTCRRGR